MNPSLSKLQHQLKRWQLRYKLLTHRQLLVVAALCVLGSITVQTGIHSTGHPISGLTSLGIIAAVYFFWTATHRYQLSIEERQFLRQKLKNKMKK